MSRKLEDIYNEAVLNRNKYLELTKLNNDSKMSVINAFTWVTSAVIYSFETLMDTFMLDIATIINSRINGTPMYYANAMLKWQYGDKLTVNDSGTAFSYSNVNTDKRIISHVSYQEDNADGKLFLKVAKGPKGKLERLNEDELLAANNYLNQIKFAGTKCQVVSRKGDILVPRLTVYYDGAITKEELLDTIDSVLVDFTQRLDFDAIIYAQKVIDVIQSVPHVTDVYIDPLASVAQGVFICQYNDNDVLGSEQKIDRKSYSSSGYLRQSSKKDKEATIPTFREAIVIKLEDAL